MEQKTTITCPECGTDLDVNDILYHQLEDELRKKFDAQLREEKNKIESQKDGLEKEKRLLEEEKQKSDQIIEAQVSMKLKAEKEQMEITLKRKLQEEESEKYADLQKELNEKSEKLKQFNQAKAEIEKLKREKDEMKGEIEAEAERKLRETLIQQTERIRKAEQDKNELLVKELQMKLEKQMELTEEMKRRQEQGSMQLQGEVLELAIEEYLKNAYPLDNIEEIKKGASGGDCIQTVNTQTKQNCGRIYYESKRTKAFGADWITKFKTDMRQKNINVGILVTQVYPKGMERMGLSEGIWICSYDEFKGLSAVIREYVIRISEAMASQENREEKMSLLYNYLTSNIFRSRIETIVEGFTEMQKDLDKEKRAMMSIWKSREKQIEKVIENTAGMYGEVRGIAGNAIAVVQALELGEGDNIEL
jgi:hypothetical protein